MNKVEINPLDQKWGGFSAWLETLRYGNALVTPIRFLWLSYSSFCRTEGFPQVRARDFVLWIKDIDGLTLKEGGSGRIRRVVLGCAP